MDEKKRNFKADVKCSAIPPEISVKKRWGKQFGRDWGCGFILPHGNVAAVFFDKRLKSEDYESVMEVINTDSPSAYIVTCEGNEWVVKTEALNNGKFGIVAYTSKGKAIMSGTGSVDKSGKWKSKVNTIYPGVRNRKSVTIDCGCTGLYCGCHIEVDW